MLNKIRNSETTRLLGVMRQKKWPYIIGLVGYSLLCALGLNIVIAFVLKKMVDAVIYNNLALLYEAIKLLVISLLTVSIVGPLMFYLCNKSIKISMINIRLKIFEHVEHLPLKFFGNGNTGDIISILNNDINVMENVYFEPFFMAIYSVILGLGSTLAMFLIDWRIAVAIVCVGIVYSIINIKLSRKIRKFSDQIQKNNGEVVNVFTILTSFLYTIRIFNIQSIIRGQFDDKNKKLTFSMIKKSRVEGIQDSSNFMLSILNFIGIIVLITFLTIDGVKNLGNAVAFIELQSGMNNMFVQLGSIMSRLQRPIAASKRVFDLLDKPIEVNEVDEVDKEQQDTNSKEFIQLHNIDFRYGEDKATLKNINLEIKEHEKVALIGESGSGKSTIIKLLLGLYSSYKGNIIVAGKNIKEYSLSQLRNLFSFVPQDVYLFNNTVYENIRYGRLDSTREEIIAAAKLANAHDFIMELEGDYNFNVGDTGAKLSQGQKQRITIARAFLKNAPIILLDEATSGLDAESEQQVRNAIDLLVQNKTAIIVTHRVSTVKNVDKIYLMEQGRILEQCNPKGTSGDRHHLSAKASFTI